MRRIKAILKTGFNRSICQEKTIRDKKSVFCLVVAIMVLAYIGYTVPQKALLAFTDSVGYRLFYYRNHVKPDSLGNGDFVVFPVCSSYIPDCNPCNVIKKIGCAEGQHLYSTKTGAYFCEGRFLGVAKTKSKRGVAVDAFQFNGIVPANQFFATGGHKDSYDSRYFGFVDKGRVTGQAIPIF